MKPSIIRSLLCTALVAAFTLAPLTTMAETPLEKGEKFLAENKTKEGVKTTASGLQYKITREGTGKSPKATDKVTVGNNVFSPADIQVSPGTTVTWTWAQDASDHNVTFNDGTGSGNKSSGTFTRTFSSGGTFPYSCTLHPGMSGTVTVK